MCSVVGRNEGRGKEGETGKEDTPFRRRPKVCEGRRWSTSCLGEQVGREHLPEVVSTINELYIHQPIFKSRRRFSPAVITNSATNADSHATGSKEERWMVLTLAPSAICYFPHLLLPSFVLSLVRSSPPTDFPSFAPLLINSSLRPWPAHVLVHNRALWRCITGSIPTVDSLGVSGPVYVL